MRVLVLGEGPNDLGHIAFDGSLSHPGAIPVFVERLINEVAPALVIETSAMRWRDLRAHRGTGFDRKLELAYGLFGRKVSGIVGVVDRDGAKIEAEHSNSTRQQRSWLRKGFLLLSD